MAEAKKNSSLSRPSGLSSPSLETWTSEERNVEETLLCDGPSSETWTRSGVSVTPSNETCRRVSWATCCVAISQRSATGTTGAHGAERYSCLVCTSSLGSHGAETCRVCDPSEKVCPAPRQSQTRLCLQRHVSAVSTVGTEADGPVEPEPSSLAGVRIGDRAVGPVIARRHRAVGPVSAWCHRAVG